MPDIIVLIPHYNDIEGLNKSLNSISAQETVDVLIVDDGSVIKPDQSELKRKYKNINDIIVLYSMPNKGQPFVENIGFKYILEKENYKYIARLDSGDTCTSERFIVQREFFEKNKAIYLVGSYASVIDVKGIELYVAKFPLTHNIIKKRMHAHQCFLHSAIMFRTEALKTVGLYPLNYYSNDDYSFLFKFIKKFNTANIDKVLVYYEFKLNSLSRSKYRKELRARIRLLFKNFSFKYFFHSIRGISKAFACYIVGVKLAMKFAILFKK